MALAARRSRMSTGEVEVKDVSDTPCQIKPGLPNVKPESPPIDTDNFMTRTGKRSALPGRPRSRASVVRGPLVTGTEAGRRRDSLRAAANQRKRWTRC
jgi:hypothetical protein